MPTSMIFQDPAFARYFFHSLDLIPIPTLVSAPVFDAGTGEEINRQHLHLNRAFVQQLGYRLSDVPDMHSWFLRAYPQATMRHDTLQRWQQAVQQARAQQQEQVQMPGLICCADGNARWFEVQAQVGISNPQFPDWHIVTFKDIHQLRVSLDKVQWLSDKDPLTQLLNRRGFAHWQQSQPAQTACMVLFDVDYFKQVNDQFGHVAGDHVLVIVADILRRLSRPQDACVRWGGEEFLVLLPAVELIAAAAFAETVRQHVSSERLVWQGHPLQVTLSAGCAFWPVAGSEADCFAKADAALYLAKQQGRNQVVVAPL